MVYLATFSYTIYVTIIPILFKPQIYIVIFMLYSTALNKREMKKIFKIEENSLVYLH